MEQYKNETETALRSLLEAAEMSPDQILIIGCSTSEVLGYKIGSASNMDAAKAIMDGLLPIIQEKKLYLAIQCCEHLNRALVIEKACAKKYNLEEVSVYPVAKAGGSLAATAMQRFNQPIVVERIVAHAGMDIGDTFIGMHLQPVAVPVLIEQKSVGNAHLTLARTRPKLIGGERAIYMRPNEK